MTARTLTIVIAICLLLSLTAFSQQQPQNDDGNGKFQVTSTTFTDGGTIPFIMVWNRCSFYPGGGNQSPELSWTKTPGNTRSFAVVMYDVTGSFTHWGMYNISPAVHELPQNAGVAGSPFGTQVLNDYGVGDLNYDGPCPPPFLSPVNHTYVFTVYALDIVLPTIPSYQDFQPGPEALYQALIAAARGGHITRSASITGFFPQPQ